MKLYQLCTLIGLLSPPCIASCIVDPNSTKDLFHIVTSQDLIPLVKHNGRLQLATLVDGAHKGDSPLFYFQKPAEGPKNIYDLVLADEDLAKPQFVAKTNDGSLILSDASTGPWSQNVDGVHILTSIFTVDCHGNIGVANGSMNLSLTAGSSASENDLIVFNFNTDTLHHALRTRSSRMLTKRDEAYRCPSGFCAMTKRDARPISWNGCGSAPWQFKFVPDFDFSDCCDQHDICYDDCNSPSVSYCNNNFHDCMMGKCDQKYPKPLTPVKAGLRAACKELARVYTDVVSGPYGAKYFTEYGMERCTCYPHPDPCPKT
ncbi:hypothetical protein CERZMDRAFT_53502 [Cercospora zeae-maydis SCOH1-5]|uniref:Phospholipase A2 domain-containing protein n=1 Tax=Cercospora zeae-maydis SCOH1-5 TaxID=717836 RepID=A0A6A6F164_9PEZI|nr:hypothetical protein CERZMDRAFT_53502 [Cercospora zeae-maydis SCOH1-5]